MIKIKTSLLLLLAMAAVHTSYSAIPNNALFVITVESSDYYSLDSSQLTVTDATKVSLYAASNNKKVNVNQIGRAHV